MSVWLIAHSQNCNFQFVALNPTTGGYFDHCSKTCARQAKGSPISPNQNGILVVSLCEVALDQDWDHNAVIILFGSCSIASINQSSRTEPRSIHIAAERAQNSQRAAVPLQQAPLQQTLLQQVPRPLHLSGTFNRPYSLQPLLVIQII